MASEMQPIIDKPTGDQRPRVDGFEGAQPTASGPVRARDIARDQGDVALIASVVPFEQTIRRLLTANGGPRMHRMPAAGDMPGAERIGIAFIGPELDVEAMAARAEQINRVNPGIYLVMVSDPRAGLFERALRAGVRDVLSPSANDDAILDVLERGFEHSARWRSQTPVATAGPSADPKKRVISVLAPKGGVGKTFATSNLSMALNTYEKGKVAIIDLDLQFGDVAGALHLNPEHTVADAARAMTTTDQGAVNSVVKVFLTPHESGLYVMCGPEDPAEADDVSYDQSLQITKALSNSFDFVVIDTCAGLDPHALSVTDISTDLVFVCSVDVSSVRSLRRELDALDRLGMTHQKRHLIVNRFDAPGGARPEDVEVAVGLQASVMLPVDRNVLAAANQGVPITVADPKSPIAKKFLSLAESIIGIESEAAPVKAVRHFGGEHDETRTANEGSNRRGCRGPSSSRARSSSRTDVADRCNRSGRSGRGRTGCTAPRCGEDRRAGHPVRPDADLQRATP